PNHSKERLYAFDQGSAEEVTFKWRDRGVTPMPYPASEKHVALWETLEKWSNRAGNPSTWRRSIIELANKNPKQCMPHERGMVSHLVRSAIGAREFADAIPRPPLEWICVFDKFVRFGAPTQSHHDEDETDPLATYGLDDDPGRTEPQNKTSSEGDDLLNWRRGDESLNSALRLSSF